jgi:hypothetical protein
LFEILYMLMYLHKDKENRCHKYKHSYKLKAMISFSSFHTNMKLLWVQMVNILKGKETNH